MVGFCPELFLGFERHEAELALFAVYSTGQLKNNEMVVEGIDQAVAAFVRLPS